MVGAEHSPNVPDAVVRRLFLKNQKLYSVGLVTLIILVPTLIAGTVGLPYDTGHSEKHSLDERLTLILLSKC